MNPADFPASAFPRALVASGALACAVGVALSAYAAHGAEGAAQAQLQWAAAFAFAHGLALAALSRGARRKAARIALALLLLGVLLFGGSLAAAALLGTRAVLAPFGGSLLIGGWLLYAFDALRR